MNMDIENNRLMMWMEKFINSGKAEEFIRVEPDKLFLFSFTNPFVG